MSEVGCVKCESGEIRTDIMVRVTGQQGNEPERIEVNKCEGCGNQWSRKLDS
jgi:hypothetical protein